MNEGARGPRRILWANVVTVLSAAILIGTVVVGTGLATGWAISGMLGLSSAPTYVIQGVFAAASLAVVYGFLRRAIRVEPFVER